MENQKTKVTGARKTHSVEIRCTDWTVDSPASIKIRSGTIPVRLHSHSITDSRPYRCLVLQFKNGSLISVKKTDLRKELSLC
jgi:hypothetical protein